MASSSPQQYYVDRAWFEQRLANIDMKASELARRLRVDRSAVSRILNGERKIQSTEITQIATLLGVTVDEVLGHTGATTEPSGFGEMKQAAFKPTEPARPYEIDEGTLVVPGETVDSAGKKIGRHPAFGALKGMITILPGVDLTEPAFEDWKDLYGE